MESVGCLQVHEAQTFTLQRAEAISQVSHAQARYSMMQLTCVVSGAVAAPPQSGGAPGTGRCWPAARGPPQRTVRPLGAAYWFANTSVVNAAERRELPDQKSEGDSALGGREGHGHALNRLRSPEQLGNGAAVAETSSITRIVVHTSLLPLQILVTAAFREYLYLSTLLHEEDSPCAHPSSSASSNVTVVTGEQLCTVDL